jgi:hypothetical protein
MYTPDGTVYQMPVHGAIIEGSGMSHFKQLGVAQLQVGGSPALTGDPKTG